MLWTSGVACSEKDPGKKTGKCTTATWCSTKTVTKLKYALSPSKKNGANCLALDYNSKKLKATDCSKKGIVFCEASSKFLKVGSQFFWFFSAVPMPNAKLSGLKAVQEECKKFILLLREFFNTYCF